MHQYYVVSISRWSKLFLEAFCFRVKSNSNFLIINKFDIEMSNNGLKTFSQICFSKGVSIKFNKIKRNKQFLDAN